MFTNKELARPNCSPRSLCTPRWFERVEIAFFFSFFGYRSMRRLSMLTSQFLRASPLSAGQRMPLHDSRFVLRSSMKP